MPKDDDTPPERHRQQAEAVREKAEDERQDAEQDRGVTEQHRLAAESARNEAEQFSMAEERGRAAISTVRRRGLRKEQSACGNRGGR